MISVLMPTYNQAEYLPAALAGLWAQTFRDFEFIVCDDGSTDATPAILKKSFGRIEVTATVTHPSNQGSAAAINSCSSIAGGDFWTWVSSDNVMTTDWLETLVAAAMRPGVGVVYSAFWYEQPKKEPFKIFHPYTRDRLISDVNCMFGPSFLIHADVWREAGPHAGKISHDYGHWLKVEEVCWRRGLEIVGIDKPLCHYRVHDQMAGRRLRHQFDAHEHQAEARRRRCA